MSIRMPVLLTAARKQTVLPESDLNQLRVACSRALTSYFERAHETCLFVLCHQKLPLSLDDRAILLLHCRRESVARGEYETARRELIRALAGPGFLQDV
jgi:hypothetical protein